MKHTSFVLTVILGNIVFGQTTLAQSNQEYDELISVNGSKITPRFAPFLKESGGSGGVGNGGGRLEIRAIQAGFELSKTCALSPKSIASELASKLDKIHFEKYLYADPKANEQLFSQEQIFIIAHTSDNNWVILFNTAKLTEMETSKWGDGELDQLLKKEFLRELLGNYSQDERDSLLTWTNSITLHSPGKIVNHAFYSKKDESGLDFYIRSGTESNNEVGLKSSLYAELKSLLANPLELNELTKIELLNSPQNTGDSSISFSATFQIENKLNSIYLRGSFQATFSPAEAGRDSTLKLEILRVSLQK